ncbi:MAG: DUF4159 domain-containing protein [Candidatus Hydrothermales bacterium]
MFILLLIISFLELQLVRLKYEGGGDWYNDPEILPNLASEIEKRLSLKIAKSEVVLDVGDRRIRNYPFLFMTGHGNVFFSESEAKNLREYLESGGFLYIDDDYGMDKFIRREIKKIFPEKELVEVPFSHPIYNIFYTFEKGLPKIHEHYPGPPKGLGIFIGDRLVLFYTYNSNISDGWTEAHGDPPEIREEAIKMGINIFLYSITY